MEAPKKIIEELFEKGVLVSPKVLDFGIDRDLFHKIEAEEDIIVLNQDYAELISRQTCLVDWYEMDSYRVEAEKGNDELYQHHLQEFKKSALVLQAPQLSQSQEISGLETSLKNETAFLQVESEAALPLEPSYAAVLESGPISVVVSYENVARKYEVKHFTNFFASRYRFLESILRQRQGLGNILAISRVLAKKDKEQVSVIGLVEEISQTKKGNLVVTLEDPTGKIKVLVQSGKKELFLAAKELVLDEVVGIFGTCGEKIIFAGGIVWPDLPSGAELKKSDVEEYALFLSDIHVGSTLFLKEEFGRFLAWIRGEAGSEVQRALAQKVKYVFIAGDLVDGVGVYPSQEEELEITDINQQYSEFCRLIRMFPSDKKIIICPGNHDAVPLAEPQSAFCKEYASALFELPQAVLVSNPALVNIGKTKTFPGFDVLLYHGYSFDYYINNVDSIRSSGGYHRSDLIMKFLLKRRHLAPSFKSTPYFPAHEEDPLLIRKIPDFFVTGHIHYSKAANYKGVTLISGSCWQGKTSFQEKLGHEPEPARVPLVNLKTREIKILKFI